MSGTVRSAATGLAISGVTATFAPTLAATTTGADGRFSQGLPVGLHSVGLEAAGYVGTTVPVVNVLAGWTTDLGVIRLRPVPVQLSVSVAGERWQAGFGTPVSLTVSVTGAPTGTALTYGWTQVSGPPVALTGEAASTLSFTTDSVAALEAAGLLALKDRFGVVGITAADAERMSYVFDVTVTSSVASSSARATVQTIAPHPGVNNVGLGVLTLLGAPIQPSYAWTCTVGGAPCAAGVLSGASSRNPAFVPDAEGTYLVAEASQAAPLTIQAARFVGVRYVDGATTCATCHDTDIPSSSGRILTPKHFRWERTRHGTFLERALDGELGPYDQSCLSCHTGGYNPEATNDGFDDVATELGWTLPPSAPGTWDALPQRLKARGGITCENCHGPGSQHAAGAYSTIGKSFSATDCNQCHAGEVRGRQGRQWLSSAHSRFTTGAVPEPGDPALLPGCTACHSTQGFVSWIRTDALPTTAPTADAAEPQSCIACHDPHGEPTVPETGVLTPRMLRRYASVTMMDGFAARGVGAGAICMTCHNGIYRFDQVVAEQRAPHRSSQGDVLLGKGAGTFGEGGYPSSVHVAVPNTCVGCHMVPASSPFVASGGHTVALRVAGAPNENACTACHGVPVIVDPLTDDFNRLAYGDYDGDGIVEGIQDEVTGLQALVTDALSRGAAALFPLDTGYTGGPTPTVVSSGGFLRILKAFDPATSDPACNPALPGPWTTEACFAFAPGAIPAVTAAEQHLVEAAWNAFFVANDGSRGIHNTAFAVSVLQRSYRVLTGVDVPGATPR